MPGGSDRKRRRLAAGSAPDPDPAPPRRAPNPPRTAPRPRRPRRPSLRRILLAEWRGIEEPDPIDTGVVPIADAIQQAMRQLGLADKLDETRLAQIWQSLVGEFVARHAHPRRIERGTLFVAVLQPALRFDLDRFHKPEILRKLRQHFGPDTIREIRFVSG